MSDEYVSVVTPFQNLNLTALSVKVSAQAHEIATYRNMAFDVTATDADGYATLDTSDLPRDLTAWELAQILNMVIRAPLYVVQRDFAAVAHMFTPETSKPAGDPFTGRRGGG